MVVSPSPALAGWGWLTVSVLYPFCLSRARNSFSAFCTAVPASSKLVNSLNLGLEGNCSN